MPLERQEPEHFGVWSVLIHARRESRRSDGGSARLTVARRESGRFAAGQSIHREKDRECEKRRSDD